MKIVTIANRNKDHIPPITTSETNPFPYKIDIEYVPRNIPYLSLWHSKKDISDGTSHPSPFVPHDV